MDSHRIKNVLGELTFGEYWNVAGCHAYAVKLPRDKYGYQEGYQDGYHRAIQYENCPH